MCFLKIINMFIAQQLPWSAVLFFFSVFFSVFFFWVSAAAYVNMTFQSHFRTKKQNNQTLCIINSDTIEY